MRTDIQQLMHTIAYAVIMYREVWRLLYTFICARVSACMRTKGSVFAKERDRKHGFRFKPLASICLTYKYKAMLQRALSIMFILS